MDLLAGWLHSLTIWYPYGSPTFAFALKWSIILS